MISTSTYPKRIKAAKEFPKKLQKVHEGRISLQPGAVYWGTRKRIRVVCNVCGHEWAPTPQNLLKGKSCPACAQERRNNSVGRRAPRASQATKDKAVELRKQGLSYDAIAEELGFSDYSIRRWCDPRQAKKSVDSQAKRNAKRKASGKQAELAAAYYQTEHGRAVHLASAEKRRALEFAAVFEIELEGQLIEVDNWELIKGDADAMEMMSFEGAEEAWAQKQKQCKRLEKISGIKWSVDHLVPLSRGGIHAPENFKLVPLADNLAKKNKVIPEDYALFAKRLFNIN